MFPTQFFMLFLSVVGYVICVETTKLFNVKGNVSVTVILNSCSNSSDSDRTLVESAIWVTERINYLQIVHPFTFGVSIHKTCKDVSLLKAILEDVENSDTYELGVVTTESLSDHLKQITRILGLNTKKLVKYKHFLLEAAAKLMETLGWKFVTLVATDESVGDMFQMVAKRHQICLKECHIFKNLRSVAVNATGENPLVIFSTAIEISEFILNGSHLEDKYLARYMLLVPLDGDVPSDLPEDSFVILPPHSHSTSFQLNQHISPTSLLLEIAEPLVAFAIQTKHYIQSNCNDSLAKTHCLKCCPKNLLKTLTFMSPNEILQYLKIEVLDQHFVYNIYQVDRNDSAELNQVFSYSIFNGNLTIFDDSFEIPNNTHERFINPICPHRLLVYNEHISVAPDWLYLRFRNESWIYAFLSLSALGVIVCLSIISFLCLAVFQKRILEGNPLMSILLLFGVMLLFCAILPLSIQSKFHRNLCSIKAAAVTLSYAFIFSLLLSRSIVMSAAAREVGFMSHISGSVQSFLTLFIFGIQVAQDIFIFKGCNDIFSHGYDFAYLMGYNTMLLIILLCFTPSIYKSQRNYREGKYFTIAIILITIVWCIWLPSFIVLCNEWKEIMICLGLVLTGMICLGAIFIPRTYLMTIAAERDKITSALPSLTTGTSVLDIYRAHTQPIYDCINVAAINAAAVARAGITLTAPEAGNLQTPDLYSCPALPEEIDFDLCDSPTDSKVTRF